MNTTGIIAICPYSKSAFLHLAATPARAATVALMS